MKNLAFTLLAVLLILSACSPASAVSSEEAPAPVIAGAGYEMLEIDDVHVEVGVGSPIPVHVNASGNLPDSCSQIEFVQLMPGEADFDITLSTIHSEAEDCVQDTLPFQISLPVNVIGLPSGTYTAQVNGSTADFELDTTKSLTSLPTVDRPFYKDDIQVNSINIEIGNGSPIPVQAVIGLSLPNSCAQLGEMRLHRDGKTFFIRLIAYVLEGENCQADSLPFLVEIPLNMVNLPEGPFEINVNGVSVSFDPRTAPASP